MRIDTIQCNNVIIIHGGRTNDTYITVLTINILSKDLSLLLILT